VGFVALTALLWNVVSGPLGATALNAVMPTMRATSTSIIIFATSVIGFGLGPLCVGLLSDLLAAPLGTESLRYAFLAPIALLPGMAYLLYQASRSGLEADRR
jgi:MFS family permease